MGFEEKKSATIHKMNNNDKSKKGSVDKRMLKIVENINKSKDYYTTSSCSGRITLLNKKGEKKNMNEWLIASHENINLKDYQDAMSKSEKEDVWFMQESPIMHICARDENKAHEFMEICKEAGFKRATIISIKPRIIIELLGSEKMETIVYRNNQDFTTDEYKQILIDEANKKMNTSHDKLKRLEKLCEKL